jgi:hypothetical protein
MTDIYLSITDAFPGMPNPILSYDSGTRTTDDDFAIASGVTTYLEFQTMAEGEARFRVVAPNMWMHKHVLAIQIRDVNGGLLVNEDGNLHTYGCDVGIGAPVRSPDPTKPSPGLPVLKHNTKYMVALVHTGPVGDEYLVKLHLEKLYGPKRPEGDPPELIEPMTSVEMIIDNVPGRWYPDE